MTVHVEAPEGAFPVGTTMKVEPVEDEQVMGAVQSAVEDPVMKVSAVDIIFLDASGNEIEPAAEIKVSMSSTVMENVEQPVIVHVDEEGVGETVESEQVDGSVVFESDRFSVYVLVETITVPFVAGDGSTYEVTVDFDKKAGVPEGAQLKVSEVTEDNSNYDDYVAQAADAIDSRVIDLNYVKLLDIEIVDANGEKVDLKAPVDVQIKLLDKEYVEDTTQIIHFEGVDETPMVVESSVEEDSVSFSADGFSIYAVVDEGDTGDYARMNLHFMNGDTEVAMIIVKNGDTRDELNTIIYDPGAGTIPEGQIFKGWWYSEDDQPGENEEPTGEPSYTVTDAENGKNIDDIRDWVETYSITENEDVYLYAMLYKNYVINYLDENNVGVGSENIFMLSTDNSSPYIVNMAYTPKDDTHAFLGWNVSDGGSNIGGYTDGKLYQNGDEITINGNVTFSVDAPEGHWLVFEENGKGATYNAPVFVKSEDATAAPPDPTRFGYTFGGWYTEVSGTEDENGYTPVVESSKFTFGNTISDKTTLYAKWTPAQTANYTVIIWKQNVEANGYDFAESITLTGNTGTNVNTVTKQGTGDNAYARINGTNKQYDGFYLKEFDQNVKITPEGDAVLNVYYDRIQYTLRFYYARSYVYNNRTYVQVNVNDEGFLQGRAGGRNVNQSLTRVVTNDYGFFSGGNTWKDVNANGLNGDATKLITDSYKQKVTLGSENIGNYNTYVVGSNYTSENNNNATNRSVSMTYYYFDVNVYYGQSVVDVWPVPSEETYNVYRGSGYNTRSSNSGQPATGIGQQIRPIHQGFYATGNGVSGLYSTVDPEMFVGNSKTAYFITYWRFQTAYQVTYNSYFSVLDDEAPDVIYHGKGYKLHESFTALTGEPWQKRGRATDNGQGWDIGTVTYDGTRYASGNSYVGREDSQNPNNMINAYYDRVVNHIIYNDGIYVDGNGNPLQNRKEQQLHTKPVVFGSDLSSYNIGEDNYWRPSDTDEYIFDGWYLDSEGKQPYTFTGTMPEHDITVYAKWRQVQYRVFLHPNADHITDLDWGSATQTMNFRVSYDGTVSTPTGKSAEYEFVGWYTDPSCTAQYLFTPDTKLNKDTVSSEYNKTADFTDPMDKWGNGATWNSDTDRFWITKKFDLYGKWRAKLIGANGIGVIYNAGEGSNAPTDSNQYLDQAQATAGAASDAPNGKQFVKWIVQTWDPDANNGTGSYVDKTDGLGNVIGVYPGDSFEVLKNDAKYVITGYANPNNPEDISSIQDATHTEVVATYTVQLRAEYVDIGAGVPTNIHWYGNNETASTAGTQFVVSDENVLINQAISAKPAETFSYEGHTFLGWARVPISDGEGNALDPTLESRLSGNNLSLEDLGVANLFLKYIPASGGTAAHYEATSVTTGATSGSTVSKVAPDERYPYHAMVAVWEANTYKVTIEKKVEGIATTQNFEIGYDFNDEALADGSVRLQHNGSKTLTVDVPYGTNITLSETAVGYDKRFAAAKTPNGEGSAPATVSDGTFKIKGDTTITVTNTRQKGTLQVNKVTSPKAIADRKNFKVAVRNSSKQYLQSTTNISFGDTIVWFDVSVDKRLIIANLPADTYTVTEDTSAESVNISGYRFDGSAYAYALDEEVSEDATVAKDQTTAVTITNSYTKLVNVTVTKVLVDKYPNGSGSFTFTPVLTENNTDITAQYLNDYLTGGDFTLTPAGEEGEDKKASITFDNLPVGAVLRLTEGTDDRYTTTIKVNGTTVDAAALTIAELSENPTENTIEFTNTRNTRAVDFKKIAMDGTELSDAQFTLKIFNGSYVNYPDGNLTLGTATMNLIPGDYELTENKSPDGYIILSNTVRFTINSDGSITEPTNEKGEKDEDLAVKQDGTSEGSIATIVVKNAPGKTLPMTGGSGTLPYTLGGIALIMASALMYGFRMRRRERRLN